MQQKILLLLVLCSLNLNLFAQEALQIPTEPIPHTITERADWRRYDNGRYTGLTAQEMRGQILPMENIDDHYGSLFFHGNYMIIQNTRRDTRIAAQGVDSIISTFYEITEDGDFIIENDRGFPALRGFPYIPDEPIRPGSRWQAPGTRAADPLNTGHPLVYPFVAEYEYAGTELYMGIPVHRLRATYASRYRREQENGYIPALNGIFSISGSHRVDILISAEDGLLIFMRDNLDITYTFSDNTTLRYTGFTLTFGHGITPMNRIEITTGLEEIFGTPEPVGEQPPQTPPDPARPFVPDDSGIEIETVPEGIRLIINDIRFIPDTAEFLPEERYRLDLIARALSQIPDRTFLVEGHTASVGLPTGEMQLSIERARRMVDELVSRGIAADRFMYIGWGGTRPIDDNSTEAGRSRNRRVEITILE